MNQSELEESTASESGKGKKEVQVLKSITWLAKHSGSKPKHWELISTLISRPFFFAFLISILHVNLIRWWCYGNLCTRNGVRGSEASSRVWNVVMVRLGSGTSHVSRHGIWSAWLETPVNHLCGAWPHCLYCLVVSHAVTTIRFQLVLAAGSLVV